MGTNCSTIKLKHLTLPTKKTVDQNNFVVTPRDEGHSPVKSMSDNEKSTENRRSSEQFTVGIPMKQKFSTRNTITEENVPHSNLSYNDTPMNISDTSDLSNLRRNFQYKKGPPIGKSTYSQVYECLNLNTGELLAVKSFKIHGDVTKISNYIENLKKEVTQLRTLEHTNIVKYYTVEVTEVRESNFAIVDIVLEYVSGGSIRRLLDKFSKLEEKVIGNYIRQVLAGLEYLHQNEFLHRNIKGSNILIDTTGIIKLTDFGCSGRPDRFAEENASESNRSFYKTPMFWSAPEVVMRKAQGESADIWSVGCVVLEMLTGLPPWGKAIKTQDEFMKHISSGSIPPIPQEISEICKDFLSKTFKLRPEDRPTARDLLKHPFVKDTLQEGSLLDVESSQTLQSLQSVGPQKMLDSVHLKTNNFMNASGTSHITMTVSQNLYSNPANHHGGMSTQGESDLSTSRTLGHSNRIPSNGRKNNVQEASRFGSKDKGSQLASHLSQIRKQNLAKVSETTLEDDGSPKSRINPASFEKTSNNSQLADDLRSKEARRKQLEEEMFKDLLRISTGKLGDYGTKEENEEVKSYDSAMKTNSLFKSNEMARDQNGHETIKHFSEDTKKTLKERHMTEECYSNSEKDDLFSGEKPFVAASTDDIENTKNRREEHTELTQSTINKQKQLLRKKFEEEMERSLAMLNSEKLQKAGISMEHQYETHETESKTWRLEEMSQESQERSPRRYKDNIDTLTTVSQDNQVENRERLNHQIFNKSNLHCEFLASGENQATIESSGQSTSWSELRDYETNIDKNFGMTDEEKLAIINEAEEVKEDSFDKSNTFGQPITHDI